MSECKSCAWERENDKQINDSKSKVAWAIEVGVSEASIRRHIAHSLVVEEAGAYLSKSDDVDKLLEQMGIPEDAVTSRGMSLRDPLSGSWQKVNWSPNRAALGNSLKYDDLQKSLEGWEPVLSKPASNVSDRAAILNMADLQIGKAMQRGGGTPETIESVRHSVNAFVEHLIENRIRTAVLVDNGDSVENAFNVPTQLVTNDLDVPAQIRTFRRLIIESIKLVAPFVDELVYVAVPSNHGAFRTGYKAAGGTTDADFGLEISHQIEDAVSENAFLADKVRFARPEPLFETAELEVAGTKLAFNHGHQSGGALAHDKFWAGQDHGRMPGWDADILVMAHYHTQALYHGGDGRWIVSCASSDPGSDWFTNRTGQRARRGMTAFDVIDGELLNFRLV